MLRTHIFMAAVWVHFALRFSFPLAPLFVMNLFLFLVVVAIGISILKSREQQRRIALLGSYLGKYQIENLMESLTEGYLRALGESDTERQKQVWGVLAMAEKTLAVQFQRFAQEFSKVAEPQARVSKLALALPFADRLFPGATFDVRQAFTVHAQGITDVVENRLNQSARDQAYMLTAELFLMQHTCHWFCRSKAVASARTWARHKTAYAQLLEAVSPGTRRAYGALVGTQP